MKQSIISAASILVLAVVAFFGSNAYAQTSAMSHPFVFDGHEQKAISQTADSREMLRVIKNATSTALIQEANTLMASQTQQVLTSKVSGVVKDIQAGSEKSFTLNMNNNASVAEGHAVKVEVSYDQRPIGGILNVKVELMPKFVGVGVAPRAIAKKTMATAVDNLNDSEVSQIITTLTQELAQEIAMAN